MPAALEAYRVGFGIAERLAKSDPGNAGWQSALSVSHDRIGNVLIAQGNLPAALDAYRADLAIAEQLAKSDPSNAGWRRDLSVSQEKIGNVLVRSAQTAQRAGGLSREPGDPREAGEVRPWQCRLAA